MVTNPCAVTCCNWLCQQHTAHGSFSIGDYQVGYVCMCANKALSGAATHVCLQNCMVPCAASDTVHSAPRKSLTDGSERVCRPLCDVCEERCTLAVLRRRDGGAHQRGDGTDRLWLAAGDILHVMVSNAISDADARERARPFKLCLARVACGMVRAPAFRKSLLVLFSLETLVMFYLDTQCVLCWTSAATVVTRAQPRQHCQ